MLKFTFDRLTSFFGILILWPLLLVVAIMIKVKMGGKVMFVQHRVGKDGKLFKIHKFRTMEEGETSSVTSANNEHITPLGKTLRHYHLDELPQLWDVFIGNMSFVGPRPDVPGYADKLEGDNRQILQLRPGITGPASLKYRNEEALLAQVDDPIRYNDEIIWPDKVRLNLYYLKHYSFGMDIKLIFATLFDKHLIFAGELI